MKKKHITTLFLSKYTSCWYWSFFQFLVSIYSEEIHNRNFPYLLDFFNPIVAAIAVQGIKAAPADSFVDSIGVNTHWGDPHPYAPQYANLKLKLAESGIRYIRDGAGQSTYDRGNDLYNSLGIKTIMVSGKKKPGPPPQLLDPTQIDEQLNEIKTQALAATVALESSNEYDLEHPPNTSWVSLIRNYTILLYTKAKSDPLLKNLPVIGPSLTSLEAYEAVGNLDPYIDYANIHLYQWSYSPGFSGWDNNGSHSINWYLNELVPQQTPSGKRVQSTEAGHHNYLPNGGVSEEADGKYTVRIFAEFFRRGIYRTCKYELADGGQAGQEGVFGLLHYNITEKSAFRAVKNLITILSDKGAHFETDTLDYSLNGGMDNVRQLLFQKRDGDFYLMVWVEVSSWNVTAKVDLYPPPQQVLLTLQDSKKITNATLYAFDNNADVNIINLSINDNQVIFNATDKISIIKLSNRTSSILHGIYRLTPKNALQLSLDVTNDSHHAGVSQSYYRDDPNQQWVVELIDGEFYRLMNRATGQTLGVDSRDSIQLDKWLDSDCQKWKLELLQNGFYRITSKQAQDAQFYNSYQQWKLDWIASIA
jgi:hypothetical protein